LSSPIFKLITNADTPIRPLRADARRNREKIVQAARDLVAERGSAAQIDDVAHQAGVGVGTVYRHFPNKEALMGELLRICVVENTQLARSLADHEDAWEGFAQLVRGCCEMMAADAAKRRTWQAADEAAFGYAQDAKAEMLEAASFLIERAHAAGVLREDFRVDDMGGLMCGLGAAIDVMPGDDGRWRRLVEFALDGLRAR
jgi:AcrR family transcriptional regulator